MAVRGSQIGSNMWGDPKWETVLDKWFVNKVQLAMAAPKGKGYFHFEGQQYFRAENGYVYRRLPNDD